MSLLCFLMLAGCEDKHQSLALKFGQYTQTEAVAKEIIGKIV